MARHGFTLLEVLVAMVVGAILTGVAIGAFGPVQSNQAVRSAQNNFVSLHAQARVFAIERGVVARLVLDAAGDSAWVTVRTAGGADSTVNRFDFRTALGVDLNADPSSAVVCMTPRGIADPTCAGGIVAVRFTRAGSESALEILPLGQVVF